LGARRSSAATAYSAKAPRPAQPEGQAHDIRHAVNADPVKRVHGGRANLHERLGVLDQRLVDVLELQDLR